MKKHNMSHQFKLIVFVGLLSIFCHSFIFAKTSNPLIIPATETKGDSITPAGYRYVSPAELAKINANLSKASEQLYQDMEDGLIPVPGGHDDPDAWGYEEENSSSPNDEVADSTSTSEEEKEHDWSSNIDDNTIVEPLNLNPNDENNFESKNEKINNSNVEGTIKEIACASAKPSITGGSVFKRAKFTIGGIEPQEIKITQSAENFAIKKEYGGLVYQMIDGKSWGSRILDPGNYILSCNGGGVMGLMSASVCIENPMAGQAPPPNIPPVTPRPDKDDRPTLEDSKPPLPKGPIEKIFVRPVGKDAMTTSDHLTMLIDEEKNITVWGEDTAGNKMNVTVDDWKVYDDDIGWITDGLHNPAPKDSREKIKFKAGKKKGYTRIKATVINKENRRINGVLSIEVTKNPTIKVTGCVKLYDENGKQLNAGGVKIIFHGRYFSREDWDDLNNNEWSTVKGTNVRDQEVTIDNNGKYKFTTSTGGDILQIVTQFHPSNPPAPMGYKWMPKRGTKHYRKDADPYYDWSNSEEWTGPSKEYKIISMLSKDFGCLILQLEKIPTSIIGMVTHSGKPVEGAKVEIVNTLVGGKSNKNGVYGLNVGNLPKGRYKLTAKYKPPRFGEPGFKENTKFTMHKGWLYITKDIWVDLPLESETKTININMISFGKKIGYTGP